MIKSTDRSYTNERNGTHVETGNTLQSYEEEKQLDDFQYGDDILSLFNIP